MFLLKAKEYALPRAEDSKYSHLHHSHFLYQVPLFVLLYMVPLLKTTRKLQVVQNAVDTMTYELASLLPCRSRTGYQFVSTAIQNTSSYI